MQRFWEIFKTITSIRRCSGELQEIREFIIRHAKDNGYKVTQDKVGNILCSKPQSTMTLQAHIDMVCIGECESIEIIEKHGKMSANNSSLGADNGIAVALMLEAIEEGIAVDSLFTVDEEIGLIGAHNLELKLNTENILNLDSEESEAIYIACAGGVDLEASLKLQKKYVKDMHFHKVRAKNLPGGHSGIDIDKNIPNANIEVAKKLHNKEVFVHALHGGERRNSIARQAEIIIASPEPLEYAAVDVGANPFYYEKSEAIIQALINMPHGVKKESKQFDIPQASLNFAQMKIEDDVLTVQLSLRAMDIYSMDVMEGNVMHYLESYGFSVRRDNFYAPWESDKNAFTQRLFDVVKEVEGFCEYKAIHAGLECGVLQTKLPKANFASIGPDIFHPHSTKEYVDMGSVERFREIVYNFITSEAEYSK